MHWILQSGYEHERGFGDLIEFLGRTKIPFSMHKIIPFVQEIEPDADPKGHVIVYGTYGMRHLSKKKGWVPGSFDLADITYADHIKHWGSFMLNSDSIFCTFDEVPKYLKDSPLFLRPVVDSKFFSGKLIEREEFMSWHHRVMDLKEDDGSLVKGSTEVMLAVPKKIMAEYRTWIVDGKVVTASVYKRGGKFFQSDDVDHGVLWFAASRANEWGPSRAYVLDVALTENGLFIVETNTLNAAGLYAADVGKLVNAIESMHF